MRGRGVRGAVAFLFFTFSGVPVLAGTTIQQNVSGSVPYINAGKSADGTTASDALALQVNGTEMMRLTASGYVWIGTTSPQEALDVNGNIYLHNMSVENLAGGAGLGRVSKGFYSDSVNLAVCITGTSGLFYIQDNGGPDGNSYANYMLSGPGLNGTVFFGNVGIGTMSPSGSLHIVGSSNYWSAHNLGKELLITTSDIQNNPAIGISDAHASNWWALTNINESLAFATMPDLTDASSEPGYKLSLDRSGNLWILGVLTQSSDLRLKKDIRPLEGVLEKLAHIRGVSFFWKDKNNESGEQIGVVAQDVAPVFPQLVRKGKNGMLSVNYSGLTVPLIEAVNILKDQNDSLRSRIQALEERVGRTSECGSGGRAGFSSSRK